MKRILPYIAGAVIGALVVYVYVAQRQSNSIFLNDAAVVSELNGKYNSLHQRLSAVEGRTRQMTLCGFGDLSQLPISRYQI
jgi:hypothetical protein